MSEPKLRFKGFNDDWEEALLTDIVHFYNGKGHEGVVDENGEYILINSKFISSDRAVFKRVSECHQKVFDDSLVMVMSDVPNGKALAKFIHIVDGKEYALNQRIGMLVFKEEFSSKFYQYPLNRNKYYLAFDSGVGQTNLRKDEVLECPIYKLSLREQTKIASFLSAVDEKISQLTQKHELLSQYKQGMMQKLFSQQIRFKADDGSEFGEWENTVLGDIADIVGGGTPSTNNEEYWSGDVVWLTPSEINQKFIGESKRTISELGVQKSSAKKLPIGTILFTSRATIGEVAIAIAEVTTNQGFQSFISNEKTFNEFLYYWIVNNKKSFIERASGSTFLEISKSKIQPMEISLPCLEEQTKIANFLSAIDQKIEVVAQQIEQAKKWKKGLLQQMFV